jgi:type IV pilus assembly protein PilE
MELQPGPPGKVRRTNGTGVRTNAAGSLHSFGHRVVASSANKGTRTMKRERGFTLIELMIVVSVIAILAGIAITTYGKQVRKARRTDAKQAVGELALREEKWRANHTKYIGVSGSPPLDVTAFGALPTSKYYAIALTLAADQNNFTITATPSTADQAKDSCGTLTFRSQAGVVTKLPTTGGCWQ